jgi:hypothetical protein
MRKAINTQIRRDNTNNITYVLKKYNDNTFTLFTYNYNMARNCYYLAGKRSGACL